MTDRKHRRRSRVPTTRFGRLMRLGMTATELAARGLAEGGRRIGAPAPSDAASAFLSAANASRLADRLSQMRGAAMKLGQLLSMESEHILPAEFADALAILRDSADSMPVGQLRRLLGREYGKEWEKLFAEFDLEPIAAASIGQVHYARALDGRELALKIQYPGVARSINSDVNNMAILLRLARVLPVEMDISGIVKETKRQLRQEADYLTEAVLLERYRALVADEPRFAVPAVHTDLTTRRILAMDYLPGEPLENLSEQHESQTLRDEVGQMLYHLVFRELFEFHFMQTDPNFANYLLQKEKGGRIVLLDFGATVSFEPGFANRYARVCQAMIDDDLDAVRMIATEIGYLSGNEPDEHTQQVISLILMICEPLRYDGVYDFGDSDLMLRARDAGLDLVFKSGHFRTPPPETIFLHRKLVGSFLLCARIRARVDVQATIRPFL